MTAEPIDLARVIDDIRRTAEEQTAAGLYSADLEHELRSHFARLLDRDDGRDRFEAVNASIDRLDRARDDLASGHVDSALVEIARLPGRKAAEGWIADARRYVQTRAALDRIESAALLEPGKTAAAPVAVVKP